MNSNCNKKGKGKYCPSFTSFEKVIVPAIYGDESQFQPLPGKYKNTLLVYEINGHIYLYTQDGLTTRLDQSTVSTYRIDYRIGDGSEYKMYYGQEELSYERIKTLIDSDSHYVYLSDGTSRYEVLRSDDNAVSFSEFAIDNGNAKTSVISILPNNKTKKETLTPSGPKGEKGDKGDRGPQGPQGPQGVQGNPGIQGNPGRDGEKGERGPQGERGPIGSTGPVGPAGPQGIKGERGERGERGPVGATGPAGATGPRGLQGEKGDKGDVGPRGQQGIQGPIGERGPVGPIGPAGPQGPEGKPGANGTNGKAATITVGTTTTLAAGSNATVTNVGTATNAILNFGIPRGRDGEGGGGGDSVWGQISGKLEDQSDLMGELNLKVYNDEYASSTSGGVIKTGYGFEVDGGTGVPYAVDRTYEQYQGYPDGFFIGKGTLENVLAGKGYMTSYTETDPVFSASPAAGITSANIQSWNSKSTFSGNYNDLTNKPTNVSAFTNDANYTTKTYVDDHMWSTDAIGSLDEIHPTIITDTYIETNGQEKSYTGWNSTDYIEVKPGTEMRVSGFSNNWNAWYNSSKTFLRVQSITSGNKFSVPGDAAYIRLSAVNTQLNSAKIEISDTLTTRLADMNTKLDELYDDYLTASEVLG